MASEPFKSGTRIEVRVGGFGFAEGWLPAQIVIPRKSKFRPAHPAGYHVVKYSDGTSMSVHQDGFRVVGKAAA